jgi:GTP-binding protein
MRVLTAEFLCSSPSLKSCPESDLPEFAFIGRSNVGKSSLINMLTGRKNLAKVSQTPGKTRLINHFTINDQWLLVDLPGYGYAKLPKQEKEKIDRMIHEYLLKRNSLRLVFLLIDSRHELLTNDREFIDWLSKNEISFAIVFTKSDKISRQQLTKNLNHLQKFTERLRQVPVILTTSSARYQGKDEILDLIEHCV